VSRGIHWAEIPVDRRVEEVEGEPFLLEAYDRRGSRSTAINRSAPVAARLDLARQLDHAAEQQQFLGQCGLAGVTT